jgi:ketosteroid isomerase-like protein
MASTCLVNLCDCVFGEDHVTQNNLELMRTLDDSWNAQDWDTFEKRHSRDTTVFWPGQAEPTRGRDNHKAESIEFFKTFPDNRLINHPYKVEIAQGEWTCTVADFTGTMHGAMKGPDGKLIAPTNKKFHIEFCTVAHWKNDEIVEEKLFYDLVGLLKQIGVM